MKKLVFAILCLLLAGAAMADWDLNDPHKMHYPQLPDLSPTGMDVDCSIGGASLADDFLCTQTGPIVGIHIWGSLKRDLEPDESNPLGFRLRIYSDIPASKNPLGYSTPGELLWERHFNPPDYIPRRWAEGLEEWWYNPVTGETIFPGDTTCWQVNFPIYADPFIQEAGTVYWLEIRGFSSPPVSPGWKTSLNHWNDDAVWQDPETGTWQELRYPEGHPMHGESIDLAFVITPVPEPASVLALGSGLLGLAGLAIRRRRA